MNVALFFFIFNKIRTLICLSGLFFVFVALDVLVIEEPQTRNSSQHSGVFIC